MDRILIEQLNKLKEIKPEIEWKDKNREILLSKISPENNPEPRHSFFSIVNQPVLAVFCILLLIISGLTANATKYIKPGNSLFIARIINEQAQLAITFNKDRKIALDIKLANNRAKEITDVMASPNFNHQDKKKINKLKNDFKNNIHTVKARLQEINDKKTLDKQQEEEDNGKIFTVDAGKTDKGLSFAEATPIVQDEKLEATTSIEKIETEEKATTTNKTITIDNIIKNIEETFDKGEFEKTKDLLSNVEKAVIQTKVNIATSTK